MELMKLEHRRQKAKQREFYDTYSEDFDKAELWELRGKDKENRYRQRFILRRATRMAKLAHLEPNLVALEVGCGTGIYTRHWVNTSGKTCGLDLSSMMLKRAASKIREDKLVLVQADAEWLPFKDSSFDAVLSVNLLEHLDNIPLALEEMRRVCKNGGKIVISMPNNNPMKYRLLRLYHRFASQIVSDDVFFSPPQYEGELTHHVLTPSELANILSKHGIQVEGTSFMGFIERKLSRITWGCTFLELLEKTIEKAPVIKSWAGIVIIWGSVSNK